MSLLPHAAERRPATFARGSGATVAVVGIALFAAAYDDGSYSLASRSAIAIAIWWTILVGVALGAWPSRRIPRAAFFTGALLAAFAAWDLISTAWAPSAERAFNEFDRTALYLGVFVLVVVASRDDRLARWLDGLALAIVATAIVALVSRLFPGSFPNRGLPTLLPSSSARLSFPLDYWNGLAIFVALGFPLLFAWLLDGGRARRVTAAGAFPLLGSVVYLSSSRGGAAAATGAAAVFLIAAPRRWAALWALVAAGTGTLLAVAVLRSRRLLVDGPFASATARSDGHRAALLLLAVCVLTAASVEAAVALGSRLPRPSRSMRRLCAVAIVALCVGAVSVEAYSLRNFARLPSTTSPTQQGNAVSDHLLSGSGSGRWQFWTAAIDEFRRAPIQGGGAGSFEAWWAEHGSFRYFIQDAHSIVFQTLAELGIVGILLLGTALGSGLVVGLARVRATAGRRRTSVAALLAAFTAYLIGAAVDWMWELTAVTLVGVCLLGLLTGPATSTRPRPSRRGRRTFAAALAALACAVLVGEAIALLVDVEVSTSQADARAGRLGEARAHALAAAKLEPWAETPYLQLALLDQSAGNLERAKVEVVESIHRNRDDWRSWLVASQIEARLGDVGLAAESLAQARSLDPRSSIVSAG